MKTDRGLLAHEIADDDAHRDAYEQCVREALKESRRDFDQGKFHASRDEMLEAVARKRAFRQ